MIRKWLRKGYKPEILYPAIDEKTFIKNKEYKESIEDLIGKKFTKDTVILTSLNRYERKKDINLALLAFNYYLKNQREKFGEDHPTTKDVYLVIAGGYDLRL